MCKISTKNKIQLLRRKKRWTQQQLAEKLHISRATVANWETGRAKPSVDTLISLSTVLETTPAYFLEGHHHDLASYRVVDEHFNFLNIQAGDLIHYRPTSFPKKGALMLYQADGHLRLCKIEQYGGQYYARIAIDKVIEAEDLDWVGNCLRLNRDF